MPPFPDAGVGVEVGFAVVVFFPNQGNFMQSLIGKNRREHLCAGHLLLRAMARLRLVLSP